MVTSVNCHVFREDEISQGYALGVISIGDMSLFFQEESSQVEQLEALRDECQRQADAIKAERAKPVAAPADPPQCSPELDPFTGHGQVPIPNLPAGSYPSEEMAEKIIDLEFGVVLKDRTGINESEFQQRIKVPQILTEDDVPF